MVWGPATLLNELLNKNPENSIFFFEAPGVVEDNFSWWGSNSVRYGLNMRYSFMFYLHAVEIVLENSHAIPTLSACKTL